MDTASQWFLRLRFVEGGWEIAGQTQDVDVAVRWDEEIDAREVATGIDHEWMVEFPYGARPLAVSLALAGGAADAGDPRLT